MTILLIGLYLIAVVIANLSVAWFGPSVTIVNAFVLIALDLTVRDALHERWQGRGFWLRMGALITGGSLLSALLNWQALPIAIASCAAFAAAGLIDTFVYERLRRQSWWVKVNGSNVVSALVDSFIFPVLAFGWPPLWGIVLGQWAAKVVGGLLWSFLLNRASVTAPKLLVNHS